MTDVDPTVKRFVDRHVEIDADSETDLDELWSWYSAPERGVPYERFKWHLLQALPDTVHVEQGETFVGVAIPGKDP